MKKEFRLDIRETFNGDLMIKELRNPDFSLPLSDCVSVTTVIKKTTASEDFVKGFVHEHQNSDVINRFKIKYDGRYVVTHAVIPTEKWVLENQESIAQYSPILFFKDGNIYRYGEAEPIDPMTLDEESLASSNVQIEQKDVFVLFNLWQCYLNYCKKLFEGECSQDSNCDNGCDDELTKNRNLLWIFLNAIQYCMKLGMPDKAQELLENISGGCNTLCSNEMFSKDYNCGCGK